MGLINWFKTTTFYGKLIRDVGKVKIPRGGGSTAFRLQELNPSLHSGERRYLLTISHAAIFGYHATPVMLTLTQLQSLHALLGEGLNAQPEDAGVARVVPGSFS